MENRRIKVRLNSSEKIEEVLQEVYDQACRQINEIQNEINKLINSTNLASEDFTMEDKAKYFKAIHDLTGDKKSAIQTKLDIVKFMGEMIKHSGDVKAVMADKTFTKRTSLNFNDIRNALKENDDTDNYNVKKND
jgi:conjugal transfer/entry exclusion protein